MSKKTSRLDRLTLLYNVGRSLAALDDPAELLSRIVEHAAQVMEARASSLLLVDGDGRHLTFQVAYGEKAPELQGIRVPIDDQSVAGRVALTGEPQIVDDVRQVAFFSGSVDRHTHFETRSILGVPLRGKTGISGVIEVLNKISGAPFTEDDVALLLALAGSAAVAIENARLYDETRHLYEEQRHRAEELAAMIGELERTYKGTMHALSALLDTRDVSTLGHSQRVGFYTIRLAQELGICDREALKVIEYGALLHDVGKIGVPDAILRKSGALTAEEWEQMRRHPDLGYRMLRDIDFLRQALPIIRHHHEHWNGAGYPDGLAGEAIPIAARLFAVADVLDALTSERPYKPALSYEQAAAQIVAERGTHFDPQMVDIFLQIDPREWQRIRNEVATAVAPVAPVAPAKHIPREVSVL